MHHSTLKSYPDAEAVHDYYKEHFDYDSPCKFGVKGYAAKANHMLDLLCPKKGILCSQVHGSVAGTFRELNEKTLGYLAMVQKSLRDAEAYILELEEPDE